MTTPLGQDLEWVIHWIVTAVRLGIVLLVVSAVLTFAFAVATSVKSPLQPRHEWLKPQQKESGPVFALAIVMSLLVVAVVLGAAALVTDFAAGIHVAADDTVELIP